MRILAVIAATVLLSAVCTAQVPGSDPRAADSPQTHASGQWDAAADSVLQYLLTASATDFHAHRPPDPLRFRSVRFGHLNDPEGKKTYLLCGEFLPAQGGEKAQWTRFATLKTSGYEQWIGGQAATFCMDSTVTWEQPGDLSSILQSRLDSLR